MIKRGLNVNIFDFKKLNSLNGWKKKSLIWFNKVMDDSDGVNDHDSIFSQNHDEQSLRAFF